MADHLQEAEAIGQRAGREAERSEIVAMIKRAIIEADDKMFTSRDRDERRNFAASSVAFTRLIDLIECGEHRCHENV